MDAAAVLATLTARGCTLTVEGDDLVVRPARGLTDALRVAIRAQKAALLALRLTRGPCPRCRQPLDGFAACPECHIRQCACGALMGFYAIWCPGCLANRFAALEVDREAPAVDAAPDPRLHPCPSCGEAIPVRWVRCATCDPDWRHHNPTGGPT